jgi:hypothetical protein
LLDIRVIFVACLLLYVVISVGFLAVTRMDAKQNTKLPIKSVNQAADPVIKYTKTFCVFFTLS